MNNKKNTLVILTPGFAESEEDSTCLPMQQLFVKTLKSIYSDLNIVVLAFHYPFNKNHYSFFGVDVYSCGGRNKGGIHGWMLRRKAYAQLKEIHQTNKIIGLLSFWYGECALVGQKFAEKNGLKHFCWILGQDARGQNNYPRRMPPVADRLIALSDFLQAEFERNHGIKPMHVISPGVQIIGLSQPERDVDIMGAGSLIPLKRYDILLEVTAELKKTMPHIKVVVAGKGPEEDRLRKLAVKLDLENNVSFTGELPYDQVLQLMQRSKVFLHPSSYEGFSGVCMEALAAGMHVISFCKAMHRSIDQWHIVNDQQTMKRQALELLQNAQARYESTKSFNMEDTVGKMMALFEN